jgi:heme-degrading monooxygenase HmoA
MTIREWRGRASAEQTEAYPDHFHQVVMPELRGRAGFLGAYLGRRLVDDEIEVVVLTRWESMEAIKASRAKIPRGPSSMHERLQRFATSTPRSSTSMSSKRSS